MIHYGLQCNEENLPLRKAPDCKCFAKPGNSLPHTVEEVIVTNSRTNGRPVAVVEYRKDDQGNTPGESDMEQQNSAQSRPPSSSAGRLLLGKLLSPRLLPALPPHEAFTIRESMRALQMQNKLKRCMNLISCSSATALVPEELAKQVPVNYYLPPVKTSCIAEEMTEVLGSTFATSTLNLWPRERPHKSADYHRRISAAATCTAHPQNEEGKEKGASFVTSNQNSFVITKQSSLTDDDKRYPTCTSSSLDTEAPPAYMYLHQEPELEKRPPFLGIVGNCTTTCISNGKDSQEKITVSPALRQAHRDREQSIQHMLCQRRSQFKKIILAHDQPSSINFNSTTSNTSLHHVAVPRRRLRACVKGSGVTKRITHQTTDNRARAATDVCAE